MVDDYTCEYGYPRPCGKPADFSIAGGRYYPACMHSCAEHVFKMAVTGEKPHPLTTAGELFAAKHWGYKKI